MKNRALTISFVFLGIVFLSLTACVLYSKAQAINDPNPYDDPNLSLDDMISLYHTNINNAFNNYFSKLMTSISTDPKQKSPTPYPGDPGTEGSAFKADKTPLTAADCFADPNNYSTFCVSVNLLGANSDNCAAYNSGKLQNPSDGLGAFCRLGSGALPLQGYFNFIAALQKRSSTVFDTSSQQQGWTQNFCKLFFGSVPAAQAPAYCTKAQAGTQIGTQGGAQNLPLTGQNGVIANATARKKMIDEQVEFAKQALDQTLSAYDQVTFAWPIHLKYVQIYADLETYRDKLVDVRHQTDLFPKKFIDLTTTSCL